MLPVQIFYAILALCCSYAWIKGGAPERIGAAIFALATVLSTAVISGPAGRFGSLEVGVLAVDSAMLLALLVLALRAERFWPLWVMGLHLIGTAGHAVKAVDPHVIPKAYAFILAFWSYPMLLLLVAGTWNHQKRLAKYGVDKSWSHFPSRSGSPPETGRTT